MPLFKSIGIGQSRPPGGLWERMKPPTIWEFAERLYSSWLIPGLSLAKEPGASISFPLNLSSAGGRANSQTKRARPGAAIMTDAEHRLSNLLDRLNAIRETAVRLRTERRGIPGGILLELIIILPDVIEDLIQVTKRIERTGTDGGDCQI